jgi:TatA/E family protein of Tat protein translocase
MGGFSVVHIIVLGVIVLILFGSDKLPTFGKSLGKAIKGFKDSLNEIDVESKDVTTEMLTSEQQAELKHKQTEADKNKDKV